MSFYKEDYDEIVHILQEHPAWVPQLRQLLLTDDFLKLPDTVRTVAEAQRHTDSQVKRLETVVERLAEAQLHTDSQVKRLVEAQQRTESRLEQVESRLERVENRLERVENRLEQVENRLEQVENRLEQVENRLERVENRLEQVENRLDRVENRLDRIDDHVGTLRGQALEQKYRERAASYFGRVMRRVRIVYRETLADSLEDVLPQEEWNDATLIDLVVKGKPRAKTELSELWLAVEISTVIDRHDVLRALRRSRLIQRNGIPTIPVVAGESLTEGAEAEAASQKVVVLIDGKMKFWNEAVTEI